MQVRNTLFCSLWERGLTGDLLFAETMGESKIKKQIPLNPPFPKGKGDFGHLGAFRRPNERLALP
jgi:hypothetical protein